MALRIDNTGTQVAITMKQGADFGPIELRILKANGQVLDLTTYTLRGQIRKAALDATVVKSFTFAVTSPTQGLASMYMPKTDTIAIPCGESPNDDASRYVYDVEAEDSGTGQVASIMWGTLTMLREVTR